MLKIKISNNRKELILETNVERYEQDLKENRKSLIMWWRCFVEYDDGTNYYSNLNAPRKVILFQGKTIYADYNIEIEGEKDIYETLLAILDQDFKTDYQPEETIKEEKETKQYYRETNSPINTNISPLENNLKKELLDE